MTAQGAVADLAAYGWLNSSAVGPSEISAYVSSNLFPIALVASKWPHNLDQERSRLQIRARDNEPAVLFLLHLGLAQKSLDMQKLMQPPPF